MLNSLSKILETKRIYLGTIDAMVVVSVTSIIASMCMVAAVAPARSSAYIYCPNAAKPVMAGSLYSDFPTIRARIAARSTAAPRR